MVSYYLRHASTGILITTFTSRSKSSLLSTAFDYHFSLNRSGASCLERLITPFKDKPSLALPVTKVRVKGIQIIIQHVYLK